jgi:hypothetical protein
MARLQIDVACSTYYTLLNADFVSFLNGFIFHISVKKMVFAGEELNGFNS